jgi:hypothetical protein
MLSSRRISKWPLLVAMVGCGGQSDDKGGTPTGSGQTTSETSTGTSGTGTTTDVTSSAAPNTDDATTTSVGQSDTGPPTPCDLACEVAFECSDAFASFEECVTGCEAQFEPGEDAADPPCRDATEAWLLCIAGLNCDEYAEWEESTMNEPGPYPCKDADQGVRDACYGTNTSSS